MIRKFSSKKWTSSSSVRTPLDDGSVLTEKNVNSYSTSESPSSSSSIVRAGFSTLFRVLAVFSLIGVLFASLLPAFYFSPSALVDNLFEFVTPDLDIPGQIADIAGFYSAFHSGGFLDFFAAAKAVWNLITEPFHIFADLITALNPFDNVKTQSSYQQVFDW